MAEQSFTDPAEPHGTVKAAEYIVVARRYRPQSFDELIGQEHVAKGLAAAIAASRVGHAYLFTGARGTGKTSSARIFAKALNCERGPTPTPCNECDICRSITAGDDMDVLEIDGASNRGIDEIRQLRQNVNVRPSRARFKVYIIDEVHMLTKEAFNALLKTLEEPPDHVKFIFCTTEPEKIPITILSRCQRFDFAGIQTSQIIRRLGQICAGEGVQAEPESLEILARRAAGSMRDSQSLLEQLLAFGSQQITVSDVHRLLGTAGSERIAQIVVQLIARNSAGAITELDQAIGQGVDVGQLLDQMLGYFRDIMATAVGCQPESLLHVSASEQSAVQSAAKQLGLETILAILQILDHTLSRLKYVTYPRTVAELGLVRICQLEDLDALSQLIAQLRQGAPLSEASPGAGAMPAAKKKYEPSVIPPTTSASSTQNGTATGGHASSSLKPCPSGGGIHHELHEPALESSLPVGRDSVELPSVQPANLDLTPETALLLWRESAARLGGLAADNALQATMASVVPPNQLVVSFPKKYNFAKQLCERPDTMRQLLEVLSQNALGQVRLTLQVADDGPVEPVEPARVSSTRQRLFEVCRQPFVRRTMEVFDAVAERLEEPGVRNQGSGVRN
ncbi:MAG: DNA polymerase III subunit gamma/tau [Pirellulales bacterium]|nr:DNA polymerase III subunit gamma/tau [Pirellulales bacterium]